MAFTAGLSSVRVNFSVLYISLQLSNNKKTIRKVDLQRSQRRRRATTSIAAARAPFYFLKKVEHFLGGKHQPDNASA